MRCRAALLVVPIAAALLIAGSVALAEDASVAGAKEVILARKSLMNSMEELVNRIGSMISQRQINLPLARDDAAAVSVMLRAFPHLFPLDSNQWNENGGADPVTDTLASPDIWIDYDDFYEQAAAAARTADELSRAENEDEIKRLHRALGTRCDLCHALYLKE
jgi:cytochrome c556